MPRLFEKDPVLVKRKFTVLLKRDVAERFDHLIKEFKDSGHKAKVEKAIADFIERCVAHDEGDLKRSGDPQA